MKKRNRFILGTAGILVLVAGGLAVSSARGADDEGVAAVVVSRADVVDKALAVGTIEPDVEVSVKSKVSGVVGRAYAEEGDFVAAGDPLLEIRPDPTPLEMVETQRALEMQELQLENYRREAERQRALAERGLISQQEFEVAQRQFEQAELEVRTARERLELLKSGRIEDSNVESVVRAPISGYILDRTVEPGDPVVPLTSYQEGTVLMTMADMEHLVFRGTVDEIDVGRLKEGMPVQVKIGALPDAKVTGRVARISLKATKEENATSFPVEIELDAAPDVKLRAGLSANAEVIINERKNVLAIPERLVTFEDGGAWVTVRRPDGTTERRAIRTGLSDAMQVEVLEGLSEGEQVLEKPTQTID
ncbi:MAG TPA: efflux RND transporter periplasmic adaptor subunit [Longimicrobiaceae bacterium]